MIGSKKINIKNLKIVKVKWVDAVNYQGWQDKEKYKDRLTAAVTVGFLFKKTKRRIVIVGNVGESQISGMVVIPSGWVKSIKYLSK